MKVSKVPRYHLKEKLDINSADNNSKLWHMFSKEREQHGYNKDDYRRIMKQLWDFIGEVFVESEHGILLDGLGYFSVASFYKTSMYSRRDIYLFPEDSLIYEPYFFNRVFKDPTWEYYRFQMATRVRRASVAARKSGKKYKCHYRNIKWANGKNKKYHFSSRKLKKR